LLALRDHLDREDLVESLGLLGNAVERFSLSGAADATVMKLIGVGIAPRTLPSGAMTGRRLQR